MRNAATHVDPVQTLIAALESGVCDEAAAKELFALGAEAVTLALAAAWRIAEQAKSPAHLHADETGRRVSGRTYWLWCFANDHNCCYVIDRSRGSPVLQRFFGEAFDGILTVRRESCVAARALAGRSLSHRFRLSTTGEGARRYIVARQSPLLRRTADPRLLLRLQCD